MARDKYGGSLSLSNVQVKECWSLLLGGRLGRNGTVRWE